ncbi:hypothetical protein [Thaumasiovibrio sp. DFM-14]|uniref:hypothetical protein n=1 Tax=Thaumasiovibrio sp. DFM-14 TaxID=3384792 RepID=UPI0039A3077C
MTNTNDHVDNKHPMPLSGLKPALACFLGLTILLAFAAGVIHYDIRIAVAGASESGPIEYMQELFLFLIVLMFAFHAWHNPAQRGFAVLVGAFFLCLLIREMNNLLHDISHGFWKYPTYLIAISAIAFSYIRRESTLTPLIAYSKHSSFGLMLAGMATLLVFSRLFGMSVLWQTALGDNYVRIAKNMAEEGTELLAYSLIFFSTFWFITVENIKKR